MPDTAEPHAPAQTRPVDPAAPPRTNAQKRGRLFAILGVVLAILAAAALAYWFLYGQYHVETDNAYVGAETAQITPQVAGPLIKVLVAETQPVKQGQLLAVIDPTDYEVALAQARAQLGQAERRVYGYFHNDQALTAQVAARQADIAKAEAQIESAKSDLDRARVELARRRRLAASGAVSGDELTQAQNAFSTAKAALDAAQAGKALALASQGSAQGQQQVNNALIRGAGVDDNPEVQAAKAVLRAAQLNLDRTQLRAPMDGIVARKDVALGERVKEGQVLMTVVPIDQAYVDANFKEVQLRKVRIGQPAVLTADLYGGGVKFHGRVTGLAGGTGAAFSVIPAQNATGNWIKVVQRLPVRITLDPEELRRHPLRVGLSMKADIDIRAGA